MSDTTMVPIRWLIVVLVSMGGIIVTGFLWWVRTEFGRTREVHHQFDKELKNLRQMVDFLVIKFTGKPFTPDEYDRTINGHRN